MGTGTYFSGKRVYQDLGHNLRIADNPKTGLVADKRAFLVIDPELLVPDCRSVRGELMAGYAIIPEIRAAF